MDYYFALDTETGGLDENIEDVLTFYGAIFTTDFQFIADIDLKLKPDNRYPQANPQALKVNGINLTEHMNDPQTITYSDAKQKILDFLTKYREKGRFSNITPMGHNIPFDLRFIWKHLVPKAEWDKLAHYGIADTKSDTDFLKRAGWLPQSVGNLSSLVEYFNIPKRPAHNAKEDTLMCVDVAKAMMELLKSKKEGGTTQDLISLLEAE